MPAAPDHPVTLGDLRWPCGHLFMGAGWEKLYDAHHVHPVHKTQGISADEARQYKQYTAYEIEWCPGGPFAPLADLVSALRAEGVLVVERGTGSWPDTARWPEWAVDAYEQAQAGYADRVWVLEYLDALAEAQPFPPAGGVS